MAVLKLLLGRSWASRSFPEAPLGSLGQLLALRWPSLGRSWANLDPPEAALRLPKKALWPRPKNGQIAPTKKCPQNHPKTHIFRIWFWAHFWSTCKTLFQNVPGTPGPSKPTISLGRSFKNAASSMSLPRAKKDKKCEENEPEKGTKNYENWAHRCCLLQT